MNLRRSGLGLRPGEAIEYFHDDASNLYFRIGKKDKETNTFTHKWKKKVFLQVFGESNSQLCSPEESEQLEEIRAEMNKGSSG